MRRLLTTLALVAGLAPALIAGAAASTAASPTWVNTGPEGSPTGVAVDPANAQNVFASVQRGIAVSRDGGRTWGTALDLRRERADVASLLAVPGTPAVLYAVKRSHAAPKPRPILLASHDAGRTWVEVGALPRPIVVPEYWGAYRGAPLVGDPTDADTLYLVASGIFKSVDAGRTWERVYSAVHKPPAGALAVDPFDSKVLYALVRGRLRTSENGGRTWRELPGIAKELLGIPKKLGIWQFWLDPHRRGTVYAVSGGYANVVWVSTDRGRTWSTLGRSPYTETLLLDPVRPGVVYAGTTHGVYVKRPGTTTWQAVGPADSYIRQLATDAKGGRLYAGIRGGGVAATRLPLPLAERRSRRTGANHVETSTYSRATPDRFAARGGGCGCRRVGARRGGGGDGSGVGEAAVGAS